MFSVEQVINLEIFTKEVNESTVRKLNRNSDSVGDWDRERLSKQREQHLNRLGDIKQQNLFKELSVLGELESKSETRWSEAEAKAVDEDRIRKGFECLTKKMGVHPVGCRQLLKR